MTRFHGRNGQFYLGQAPWTGSGQPPAASPVANLTDWTLNKTTDKVETTAMGDQNKTYTAGLSDAAGDISGWYDSVTPQTYAAATDGLPRSFYLYEDAVNQPANYWFGVILPDMSIAGGVSSAVSIKSSWSAAGPVQRSRAGVIG